MVIHTKERSFDSKFELPYGSTRYSLDSQTAIKSSSCCTLLGEHSKKRYSDLPEKPRSNATINIEKMPEKRPKQRTRAPLHLPASSLKKRFRLFVDDTLVKKKRDHSRGAREILDTCVDHIHAYDAAYKSCIESRNGLRKWTHRHAITECHTTNTPHDTA